MLNLLLERQPVTLDQFVERRFFGFVALVEVGLRIGNRHRQAVCLQLPWSFRIALLMAAVLLWSGMVLRHGDPIQRDQMGGPFGPVSMTCPGRLAGCDRPLPVIHYFTDRFKLSIKSFS